MINITENYLIAENIQLGETGAHDKSRLGSCLASYTYYTKIEDQISAIYRSIIKNHPFVDGNKRVAVTAMTSLASTYGLTIPDDNTLYNITIYVASSKGLSPSKIAGFLFNSKKLSEHIPNLSEKILFDE